MQIYVDTREKPHAIRSILAHFEAEGVEIVRQALPEGDYTLALDASFVIDRKQNLAELCGNLTWERGRFMRELERAKEKGKTLCILVENCPGVLDMADVARWMNPRHGVSPKGISGPHLYKMMLFLQARYGVVWRFCDAKDTGAEIMRLLQEQPRE